ncbi:hypothetical protein Pth03_25710 [Planotetraspora thailandica]|uniref:Uncharacterized protein n=1 Tax=Planotetraspora thailandica TaxID=487172 RepID=A0A8J3UZ19_9ACTN|nr:hypothetical protein [Planotetraspora thailandica]GII54182.1 hypothetical protein Pth03_25710 [Planotetraspora thailandica]
MKQSTNIRLTVAPAAMIVFLLFAVGAGIAQVWPLFMVAVVLTVIALAYTLAAGEHWRRVSEARAPRFRRR